MTNKNYVKGRRKEYKVVQELRDEGFNIVQRTAGSHSPIDIIAINKLLRIIKLIQVKPDDFSQAQEEKLIEENSWLNNAYRVEFVIK